MRAFTAEARTRFSLVAGISTAYRPVSTTRNGAAGAAAGGATGGRERSIASTLLALTSVERVRDEDDVVLDENAGAFILEPFAAEVIQQARDEAQRSASEAIERSRPPVAPPAPPPAAPLRVVETGR